MTFTEKLLSFSFDLATGNFSGGGNTASISGLRASVSIIKNGTGQSSATIQGAIFGMPLSQMNQLTTLGKQIGAQGANHVTVQAGDSNGLSTVFVGNIFNAYMDGQSQPQVCFRFSGNPDAYQKAKPAQSTSVQGSMDVATTMQKLAGTMGLQFENNSVAVKLQNMYLSGSARMQAAKLAQAAGIQHIVDNGKLAIWNAGQSRQGGPTMISPQTGMVGYPTFDSASLNVKTEFNPAVVIGQNVTVQSNLKPACGTWNVIKILYELETTTPHGRWFQTLNCVTVGPQDPQSSS